MKSEIPPQLYIENEAQWIEVSIGNLLSTNLDRNESVEVLSRICRRQNSTRRIVQSVENLSSKQRAKKFGLLDRRSC